MILISVIVPVYKVEHYLKECVDTLINQTYKNLEIILIDDGSPDSCPAICDSYAAKDNRVHVIHKTNGGLSDARNTGIKAATGDYLLFVDSDDKLADCNVINNLVEFLEKTCPTVTYCSWVKKIYDSNTSISLDYSENDNSLITPCELLKFVKKNHGFCAAWTFVVRRLFIVDNSIYFVKDLVHEDTEWVPRLLLAKENLKMNIFTKPFYLYRNNPNSITSSFNQLRFDCLNKTLENLSIRINQNPQNLFMKEWFNWTLYYLTLCFEYDCLSTTALYKSNFSKVKQLFKSNYKHLAFRNKVLYAMICFNPKSFFLIRRFLKKGRD